MTQFPFILFNKSPEQLRRQGARGGKTYGRNLRARRALTPPAPTAVSQGVEVRETAAAAIQVLDAQFPWLRGAEKATPRGLVKLFSLSGPRFETEASDEEI